MKVDWGLTKEDLLILTVFYAIVGTTMIAVAVIQAVYGDDGSGYKMAALGLGVGTWMTFVKLIHKRGQRGGVQVEG